MARVMVLILMCLVTLVVGCTQDPRQEIVDETCGSFNEFAVALQEAGWSSEYDRDLVEQRIAEAGPNPGPAVVFGQPLYLQNGDIDAVVDAYGRADDAMEHLRLQVRSAELDYLAVEAQVQLECPDAFGDYRYLEVRLPLEGSTR